MTRLTPLRFGIIVWAVLLGVLILALTACLDGLRDTLMDDATPPDTVVVDTVPPPCHYHCEK